MRLSRPFRFNYELISSQDHSAGRNKKKRGRAAARRAKEEEEEKEEEQEQLQTSPEAWSLPAGGRGTSLLRTSSAQKTTGFISAP